MVETVHNNNVELKKKKNYYKKNSLFSSRIESKLVLVGVVKTKTQTVY